MTSALKRRHAPSRLFKLMCLVLWSALAAAPVSAERRLALVIGIDAYKNLPRLEKAVNDARSIAAVLQELGFTVTTGEDLSRQDIGQKLADLDTAIQPGDMVFFFFSGHGVALGSDNILIPADMPKPKSGQDGLVRDEGYSVDAIIRRMQGRGAKVTMLVLDACRDNPFAAAGVRNIGVTRGLGRVDAPSGVFVLFSAGLGQTALDRLRDGDPATNSVFTRHLVPLLQTPGLSHVQIAKRVQQEVNALAATISHPQQPAYYDQIVGDIVLRPGAPPLPDVERMRAEERRRVEEMQKQLEEERKKLAAVVRPVPAVPPKVIESAVGVFSDGRTYRPGESFKDCDVCPEMVVVPSGSFVMGSLEDEPNHFATESPQLTVTFTRAFAVGRYAVTRDEFELFVKETGHATGDTCWDYDDGTWRERSKRSFRNPGFPQDGSHPAVCVNWPDAAAYARWLSKRTGKRYRLLSEAEREYVTRAGTETPFWWGTSISPYQANYNANYTYGGGEQGEYRRKTMPVRSFEPNPWGLYQVHGNVLEWLEDCWHTSHNGARTDGSARTSGNCSIRVLRAGSWASWPWILRSASRYGNQSIGRASCFGLRVARTL